MSDTRMTPGAPAGELISRLSEQVSTLVREELALARTEVAEKGKRAGTGAGMLGGAGVLALYGVSALLLTVGALLALVWPAWLAALVVTVAVLAVAGVAAVLGRRQVRRAVPPVPADAMASTARDVGTVRSAVGEGLHR